MAKPLPIRHRVPTNILGHVITDPDNESVQAACGARTKTGLHHLVVADLHSEIDRCATEELPILAALLHQLRASVG